MSYERPVPQGAVTDLVVDAGRAYAVNTALDRVEVLALATGILEAPIAVGDNPIALDLSADGRLLYVVNSEGGDISVVDLALHLEVRRISVGNGHDAYLSGIAVMNNGKAWVSRNPATLASGGSDRVLLVDLATGVVTAPPEANSRFTALFGAQVKASGDRSSVGLVGGASSVGEVARYSVATGAWSGPRALKGNATTIAMDGAGTTMIAGAGGFVVNADLTLRATLPGPESYNFAVNAPGTFAYRTSGGRVEVIDLARGVATRQIGLPGPGGRLALTPDGTTLVVLTTGSITVVPVSAATDAPCPAPPAPAGVIPICGAPLSDVVVDGHGHAFASNPERNQIEVVALATGTLEAPIPVGSRPTDLDLTADGNGLVVANSGADDVSVVDLGLRREVRRIQLPDATRKPGRPNSLAVAANGIAFVTTQLLTQISPERLIELDLAAGTGRERTDAATWRLASSGDHTRIFFASVGPNQGSGFYSSATASMGPGKFISGAGPQVVLDQTGSRLLSGPGTYGWPDAALYDGNLVRRATFPDGGVAIAINPAGTRGYRAWAYGVNVLDLATGLEVSTIAVPEVMTELTSMAVAPDDTKVVVLTPHGVVVRPVSAATPIRRCDPAPIPAGVTAVCGALADVVLDGTGHAYASNPRFNEIEVLDTATGALEAPIPVGSRPRGLDLSADGTLLYVADSGAEEISVVDLSQRREVRRISITSGSRYDYDQPYSIAVGDHGIALVTTTIDLSSGGERMLQVDLAEESVRVRSDFGSLPGRVAGRTVVRATGDRSRIAVLEGVSNGPLRWYTAATDSFGPVATLDGGFSYLAVDQTGARLLLGPGGYVLDGYLRVEGSIPSGGTGVAISADGTMGYRVQGSALEVLDLDARKVVRTVALPEPPGGAGGIAVSPDGAKAVVLTNSGMVVVDSRSATLQGPYSVWTQPGAAAFDGIGSWIGVVNDPTAASGQLPPTYLFGHFFGFVNSAALGVIGLVTEPAGKFAVLSIAGPDGLPRTAVAPFNWTAGHHYFPLVYQVAPGTFGGWVYDYSAGAWTGIGLLNVPLWWGKIDAASVTGVGWYGAVAPTCASYPRAEVVIYPPTGYIGTTPSTASLVRGGANDGDCAAQTSADAGGWTRYRVGS